MPSPAATAGPPGSRCSPRHAAPAPSLLAATRLLTQRMPLTRLPAEKVRAHRELSAVRAGGRVEAYTYATAGTELDNIADILRRAHLEEGVPWQDMAVLVRAGGRSIPAVRRALTSAGVPLDIAGNDVALRHEPAVAPLLTALRAVAEAVLAATPDQPGGTAADRGGAEADPVAPGPFEPGGDGPAEAGPDPDARPAGRIRTDTALMLLASPLGGMDAADLRRLGRALRDEERAGGNALPAPSDELLARAVAEPERLLAHDPGYAQGSAAARRTAGHGPQAAGRRRHRRGGAVGALGRHRLAAAARARSAARRCRRA